MARHVKTIFDRMPVETRELIGRLRMEGRTIHEIRAHLAELGVHVAVSTLGRYTRKLDQAGAEIWRMRAAAEDLMGGLGEGDASHLMRLNIEMLSGAVMGILTRAITEEAPLSIREMKVLAETVARLAAASKTEVDREISMKRAFAERAADETSKVARSAGLSDDLVERFRSTILGLPGGAQ